MITLPRFLRSITPLVLVGSTFAVGYGLSDALTLLERDRNDRPVRPENPDAKREMTVVYIGSSSCAPSNNPKMPVLIEGASGRLEQHAKQLGIGFAKIGIARDRDSKRGIEHLNKIGSFDTIVTGRGWLNPGLTRYVYKDLPGPAVTPQVVITIREIDPRGVGRPVSTETILLRKVGVREIVEWVEAGAPIEIDP